jgi:ABC-type polysaccharide/polyol phosphate transport system ATPase subunit
MTPPPVIDCRSVGLRYRTYRSRRKSLREALFRSMLRRDERVNIWVLKDVSFQLPRSAGSGERGVGVFGQAGRGRAVALALLPGAAQSLRR